VHGCCWAQVDRGSAGRANVGLCALQLACLCRYWPSCLLRFLSVRHRPAGRGVRWVPTHPPNNTHTHTRLTALCPGLPGSAGTRRVKPIWILLKQKTVSGSSISWAICKSAPRTRQTTTPAPHHSVFYRPDALPAAQPTASKH